MGTAFSDRPLATIDGKLEGIRKQESTFQKLPDLMKGEEVFWVKLELVADHGCLRRIPGVLHGDKIFLPFIVKPSRSDVPLAERLALRC